tara:strand:+ start:3702 stop:3869 length:168 start_codon:yes stop_codon:yes gene_type:complete
MMSSLSLIFKQRVCKEKFPDVGKINNISRMKKSHEKRLIVGVRDAIVVVSELFFF